MNIEKDNGCFYSKEKAFQLNSNITFSANIRSIKQKKTKEKLLLFNFTHIINQIKTVSNAYFPNRFSVIKLLWHFPFTPLCPKLFNEIRLNLNLRLNLTENPNRVKIK